ncbi:DUF262 domain-containing protein [Polyangium fumosum]|uniref:DUF262 domain-containing protein n=1 Tax=Polyangium fumosum TaxID=889272 RepID=A0A4U1JDM6_9BACT|nr:DUF262 domain-containing protein [Polyangium fumosum]TKD07872.1 DUF262 domain-containing protein [Polyangium fumosum]
MSSKEAKGRALAGLLPNEKIVFKPIDDLSAATDEDLNSRYVKGEVRIVTESARYPLAGILSMLEETVDLKDGSERELRYKLDPEYQRRHRWSDERKSRLIESFLMNVPVPPVFLFERDFARFEVMDGRQRLTALSEFYADKLVLCGLQYWPELNDRTYSTLPSKVRVGIDRRYISAIILLKETAPDEEQAAQLKKMVFERLNSGGVALSSQEARNAVYPGPLNQLCLDLSRNATFRAMWGIPGESSSTVTEDEDVEERDDSTNVGRRMFERMDDVELVLRFFAYRQIDSFPGGLNKISALLDWFLSAGNKFSVSLLESYRTMFERTVEFLFSVLGATAFCRLGPSGKHQGRPTKIVYDPLMFVASQYAQGNKRKSLVQGRQELLTQLGTMYAMHKKLFAGRSTNSAQTQERNVRMKEAFDAALAKLSA